MRPPPDGGPGALAWIVAAVGVGLPWAGAALLCLAVYEVSRGLPSWWLYGLAGFACFLFDVLIDLGMARTRMATSDQPDLNRRSDQLVGRVFDLAEPIEGGRGKVRVGDTLWVVSGLEASRGVRVKVVRASGMLLHVELIDACSENKDGASNDQPHDRA